MKEKREKVRLDVLVRDNNTCVVPGCDHVAEDVHHIIERALWTEPSENGGYLPENLVSLCNRHHQDAEKCFYPPEACRRWAGITNAVVPKQMDSSKFYNKWGVEMRSPNRDLIKYPHTPYLIYSPGVDVEDIRESGYVDHQQFLDKPVVVTIKMDGSNACLNSHFVGARSGSEATHSSFDMLKQFHASICSNKIPENVQVFCEWLYAKHSIHYAGDMAISEQQGFCQIFGMYDRDIQMWYGWNEIEEMAHVLEISTVPVVETFRESNKDKLIKRINKLGKSAVEQGHEGIVIRSAYPFHWSQFSENMGKYVRPNHVTTDKHWSHQKIIRNELVSQIGV